MQNLEIYRRQGFLVLPHCAPDWLRKQCFAEVSLADREDLWQPGDHTAHAWEELHLKNAIDVPRLVEDVGLNGIVGKAGSSFQWLNRYSTNQYIQGHRDAGGDAHLLIVLGAIAPAHGGQLWIGKRDRLLPLGEGDGIIFPAALVAHGTTPVTQSATNKRLTFNVRFFDVQLG